MVTLVTIASLIIIGLVSGHSDTKYTIETEHGKYYTNQFRMCGKGIAFDTDNKKVIVMGNFNIISNLE